MKAGGLEEDAFVNLLIEWQRRLYAFILTLVPNFSDADDVLQETNAVLLRKRNDFVAGSDFGAWACQVAYFEVLNYRKRKTRNGRCAMLDESVLEELASEASQRVLGQEAKLTALGQCLERLSANDRELVRQRYRLNCSAEEIAAKTGRTAGAIRQVLYRIRCDLLRCIERRLAREEHA